VTVGYIFFVQMWVAVWKECKKGSNTLTTFSVSYIFHDLQMYILPVLRCSHDFLWLQI